MITYARTSRVLLRIDQKYAPFSLHLSNSQRNIVSLIIALLLAGLIVDLGGGPNHERTGFKVGRIVYALNSPLDNLQISSTGNIRVLLIALVSWRAISTRIAFWHFCL